MSDLNQLTRFHYLQKFSRMYVNTPEPCSSGSVDSEPFSLLGATNNSLKEISSGSECSNSSSNNGIASGGGAGGNDSNSADNQLQFSNKDAPLCTKCKLHGIRSQVKGHKKNCPKKDCRCDLCVLTDYGKRLRGKKSKKSDESDAISGDETFSINSEHGELLQKNAEIIVEMLKDRLQKDGLDYQEEVSRLKDAVLYLLLKQFDKSKLYSKFCN